MILDDACRLLNIAVNSSQKEIHSAWRRLVLQCHPDRLGRASQSEIDAAQAKTKKANQAYALLREHVRGQSSVELSYLKGQAPTSEGFLRRAKIERDRANEAVQRWARHLNRSRVALVDGRRLCEDTESFSGQVHRLSQSLRQLIRQLDKQIDGLLNRLVLNDVRTRLTERQKQASTREKKKLQAEAFLPKSPENLMVLLSACNEIAEAAVEQAEGLKRRFEQLKRENQTLKERAKTQKRTLKRSLDPFIEAAQEGRRRVDAAYVATAECHALIETELRTGDLGESVLLSRRKQIVQLCTDLEQLEMTQIEADAAEIVYDRFMKRQDTAFQMTTTMLNELEGHMTELAQVFQHFTRRVENFGPSVLERLEDNIGALIETY